MAPQTSTKLTYEDYVLLPDDGRRHEIIDGEHYVNPAPNLIHQAILLNIASPLRTFVRRHRLGYVYIAPADVVLSRHDVLQPDLIFIRSERRAILTKTNVQGAPDWAIEIVSSNRQYDEVVKLKSYDDFGVAEYWIVDPDREVVKTYRRVSNRLTLVEAIDPFTTPLIPGFAITRAEVFELDF